MFATSSTKDETIEINFFLDYNTMYVVYIQYVIRHDFRRSFISMYIKYVRFKHAVTFSRVICTAELGMER